MSHGARPTPLVLARGLVALALVVAGFFLLKRYGLLEGKSPLFALGFLVVAGSVGGSVAAFVGLPRLTGYLIAGLIVGPQGSGLLTTSDVKALSLLNALALALIALQAGAELTVAAVRRIVKSVASSALFQILFVIPVVGAAFFVAVKAGLVPFMTTLSTGAMISVSILVGAIAFCRSPSVALAVLAETRAKGPLAEWSLGVVVLLDVVILPVFAAALAYVRAEVNGDPFSPAMFLHIGYDLFASLAAGVTLGLIIAILFRIITTERVLLVVVLSYGLTALCAYLRYDTLFVFVIAGFVVTNLTRAGPGLVETSERTSAAVMVVFFATAGAKLDLGALKALWAIVLVLFVVRAFATWLGARAGHKVARDPPPVTKNAWLVLISQAGITIGLATVAADAVPALGPAFASMIVAVVAINELIGAALTKLALIRAGEVPKS